MYPISQIRLNQSTNSCPVPLLSISLDDDQSFFSSHFRLFSFFLLRRSRSVSVRNWGHFGVLSTSRIHHRTDTRQMGDGSSQAVALSSGEWEEIASPPPHASSRPPTILRRFVGLRYGKCDAGSSWVLLSLANSSDVPNRRRNKDGK
jgi:hypothetical protein